MRFNSNFPTAESMKQRKITFQEGMANDFLEQVMGRMTEGQTKFGIPKRMNGRTVSEIKTFLERKGYEVTLGVEKSSAEVRIITIKIKGELE